MEYGWTKEIIDNEEMDYLTDLFAVRIKLSTIDNNQLTPIDEVF